MNAHARTAANEAEIAGSTSGAACVVCFTIMFAVGEPSLSEESRAHTISDDIAVVHSAWA
jgi:hypothetical protein